MFSTLPGASHHKDCRARTSLPVSFLCFTCLFFTGCSDSSDNSVQVSDIVTAADRECVNHNALRNPYFGDTHVHTVRSFDSFAFDVRLTPRDAFRFAKGDEVGITPYNEQGEPMRTTRLDRPLDWAMLSDHAEFFGEISICTDPSFPEYEELECFLYRSQGNNVFNFFGSRGNAAPDDVERFPFCGDTGEVCTEQSSTIMLEHVEAAEGANDRSDDCLFTAFVGYEWTGQPELEGSREIQNIHRNVLFANEKVPPRPASYLDSPYPEDLWERLTSDCIEGIPGCDVLTIPHNSNLSAGLMFEQRDRNRQPFTAEYARMRARFEPIIEIFQHKGASECIADGSDPDCSFEFLPWGHLLGFLVATGRSDRSLGVARENAFARHALREGLALENDLDENPFKFGFFGATDTHMGTPGMVAENNFPGHTGARFSPDPLRLDLSKKQFLDDPHHNPGGLSVVWAEQNTRAALFAAMQRREVYGTSGPRHVVRFFGGWDYEENLCASAEPVQAGYDQGVPMGSDLAPQGSAETPRFLVMAMKDSLAGATDLQNIQIIKGWVDEVGGRHEKVFEVAGNRDSGAEVDLNTCTSTGSGFDNLCAVWVDPEFNGQHSAFYYARVLESPSCRWTSFQCLEQEINCADPDDGPQEMRRVCCDGTSPSDLPELQNNPIPKTVQERSWSSPIWYTPAA
jgi:hypothetical protein